MQASLHILDSIDLASRLQKENAEAAFLQMGQLWVEPPPLYVWKGEPGRSAYLAVERLLDSIECKVSGWKDIRTILASCCQRSEQSFVLARLYYLDKDCRQDALSVLAWVGTVGGLHLSDFEDGGARFLRLVLRKRAATVERILKSGEVTWK